MIFTSLMKCPRRPEVLIREVPQPRSKKATKEREREGEESTTLYLFASTFGPVLLVLQKQKTEANEPRVVDCAPEQRLMARQKCQFEFQVFSFLSLSLSLSLSQSQYFTLSSILLFPPFNKC